MPKKILLADDSITIQKVVELTFSDGDYEVTAVNNGARAIQKLGEMRPDIILSDIIMPEKNGYEVCEYVKSHPDYRNIPVVLLTGTFEPFDPDRADKAGCDAVVTKPFESQSLIHKVEELIEQSRAAGPAPTAAPAAAAPAGFDFDAPPASEKRPDQPSPWTDEPAAAPNTSDIFGAAPPSGATTEMPFESSPEPSRGETQGFPQSRSGDQDNPATTQQFTPPAEPSSPWDQPQTGGETRAFPKMSFEDMQRMGAERPEEQTPAPQEDSPFGAPPPAEEFSGETRAFPKMNFDDFKSAGSPPAAPAEDTTARPEESPWGGGGGETRGFPPMSFDQPSAASEEPAAAAESAPAWGESQEPSAPDWSSTAEPPAEEERPAPFSIPEPAPFEASSEAEAEEPQDEQEPAWSAPAAVAATGTGGNGVGGELSDEQIDRIARRVVQLMSDQVVRNIAWEVIPDMAEMVVKERIRQLESET